MRPRKASSERPKRRLAPAHFPWEEVFDSMGDGLVVLDSDRRLIGINPAAERLIGLSAEAALGYLIEEVFPPPLVKGMKPAFGEVRTWTLRDLSWDNRRGEKVSVDLSLSPLIAGDGEPAGWVLIFRDMSPVKNLEEEVRKADRLAMMGTIAAGLAHEIKNPLSGIKGAAQMIGRDAVKTEARQYLEIIVRESERVNRLITDLLMFARPKTLRRTACNVNEILDSLLKLEKETIAGRGLSLERHFDPSLPLVAGDSEQLTQAFLNFLKNAIESMSTGGRLTVRSHLYTGFRIRERDQKKSSRMVAIEIQDEGGGIPEGDRTKIFTPFFTTKEQGTGLGLAIAQRIIQEHQGLVRLESTVGRGTTVRVLLRSVS